MRHVKLRPGTPTNAAALSMLIEAAYSDIKPSVEHGSPRRRNEKPHFSKYARNGAPGSAAVARRAFGTKKAHGTIPWAKMFREGPTKRQLRAGEAQVHAALLV
jgi:hypothetical protein